MKFLIAASMMLCTCLLQAQDSVRTVLLEDVFIEGVRASELAPVSQSTIQKQKIEAVDIGQDASVVLERLSPSIVSFSDAGSGAGNYNQFRLRGIDQTRVNITLNGIPLNDMVDQGVFFSNFVDFTSSVESIQVQRGVGLSSNGTASYAGSVSYESINLDTEESGGQFNFATGSFGTVRLNAEARTGRNENGFSTYARASRIVSDGYKYHSGSNAQSFFVSSAKFFDRSVLKVTGFAGKTQNDQAYLPVLLSDIEVDPRTNYFSRNDTDDFEQELLQIQYGSQLGETLNWNSTIYYGGARGFFPFFDSFANAQTLYILSNNHYGGLSQLSWTGSNFQLHGGFHAYTFRRENQTATSPNVANPVYEDETIKDEFSAFTKFEYDMNALTLYADLQVRSVGMTFVSDTLRNLAGISEYTRSETFFNPRLGLTYQLNDQSNVFVSFGRTGREPTRTDLLQGDFNSAISEFNYTAFIDDDQVKSEFVNDLEIGYRFVGSRLNLAINGFFMDFENEISIVGGLAQNSYVALRQNVESSSRSGVELDLEYKASESTLFGLQSTFMNTNVDEFDTGTEVLTDVGHVFAPDLVLSPYFRWQSDRLIWGVDTRYVSESFMELGNNSEFAIPSFFVVNSNINWKASENVELGLRVNNLFDELYFTDGAPVDSDFDGNPEGPGFRVQPPRNYFFTLNVKI